MSTSTKPSMIENGLAEAVEGPNRGGLSQARGEGGSGRGGAGAGRGGDTGRGYPSSDRGRSTLSHYGPPRSVAQAHAVSEQAYNTEVVGKSKIV